MTAPSRPAVQPAESLKKLAKGINSAHHEVTRSLKNAIEQARQAGDLLNQAKERFKHGEWLPWLAANCPDIATRTAQSYMQLARGWHTLESKCAEPAHLTIEAALETLAKLAEPPIIVSLEKLDPVSLPTQQVAVIARQPDPVSLPTQQAAVIARQPENPVESPFAGGGEIKAVAVFSPPQQPIAKAGYPPKADAWTAAMTAFLTLLKTAMVPLSRAQGTRPIVATEDLVLAEDAVLAALDAMRGFITDERARPRSEYLQ